jgi:hypothetical protein
MRSTREASGTFNADCTLVHAGTMTVCESGMPAFFMPWAYQQAMPNENAKDTRSLTRSLKAMFVYFLDPFAPWSSARVPRSGSGSIRAGNCGLERSQPHHPGLHGLVSDPAGRVCSQESSTEARHEQAGETGDDADEMSGCGHGTFLRSGMSPCNDKTQRGQAAKTCRLSFLPFVRQFCAGRRQKGFDPPNKGRRPMATRFEGFVDQDTVTWTRRAPAV